MTLSMYDGAYDATEIAAAKAAGAIAMSHYLVGPYASTSAQPAAIRADGLGAVMNWERDPTALIGASRAQGQAIAQEAIAAVDPGCPRGGTVGIYFSVDAIVALSGITSCDASFLGLNDVCRGKFKVKAYGEGALIDHLVQTGLVQGKQWLSASSSFPDYNPNDLNVCMTQQVGTDVPNTDKNIISDPHALDAWWPDNSPYGADMPLSQADADLVVATLLDHGMNSAGFNGTLGQLLGVVAGMKPELDAVKAAQATGGTPIDYNALAQAVLQVQVDHLGLTLVAK